MRLSALLAAAMFLVLAAAPSAEARPYDGSMWGDSEHDSAAATPHRYSKKRTAYHSERREQRVHSSTGGRPRQWCGWWMRTQKGGGANLNLAWNWSKWGSSASPQVGAVVVWRHHVGMITGQAANGQWIVTSGNDGGRVRSRARSVAGAVFRI